MVVRPTYLDISTQNYTTLYKQLTTVENDYFRKQFVLQLAYSCNITKNLLTKGSIKAFYKNCYAKDDMLKYVNFDEMDDSNRKKTIGICSFVEKRIRTFYMTRDPSFHNIVQASLKTDDAYLQAKIDAFKCFTHFKLSLVKTKVTENDSVDYSFKKFGFIKLGNKQINNVWKIQSGIDNVQQNESNANTIYENLKVSFTADEGDSTTEEKDEIVKQWQILRLLRSQYLFEFDKVSEDVTLKGLFDPALAVKITEKQNEIWKELDSKINEDHKEKLLKAREYQSAKKNLKRKAEEVKTNPEEVEINTKEQASTEAKKVKLDDFANSRPETANEETQPILSEEENHPEEEDTNKSDITNEISTETKTDSELEKRTEGGESNSLITNEEVTIDKNKTEDVPVTSNNN